MAEREISGGWRPIESAPSANGDNLVWVFGGRHVRPTIVAADGGWWRIAKAQGLTGFPTLWAPCEPPPLPPDTSETEGGA